MNSMTNVSNLFQSALTEGNLTPSQQAALAALDAGRIIQAAIGISVDDVRQSRVTLYGQLVDDSGSIRMAGNSQVVRDGHNLVIDSLRGAKQRDDILAMTQYLNGTVLFPFSLIDDAVRMDTKNFNPNGGTPLYDQSLTFLTTGMLKCQEFEDSGVQARGCWLITGDGADAGSRSATPAMVCDLVEQLYRSENHIVAAMGISDAPETCSSCSAKLAGVVSSSDKKCPKCKSAIYQTDFHKVFSSMGIRDEWILTPKNTEAEIRAAFQLFSQSAVRVSQHAGAMSNLGGFGG